MLMRPDRYLHVRLRDHIAAMILDGRYGDGDALPSVRSLAADTGANPLTVAKAYQAFIESGVIVTRRGIGLFVAAGGRSKLRLAERMQFLGHDWPSLRQEMELLGLNVEKLVRRAICEKKAAVS